MKVTLNGTTLAESENTILVENNHYFPPSSVNLDLFTKSNTSTVCAWKGRASYYNAAVDDDVTVKDVAWYYPTTSEEAANIQGYVAFYRDKVIISD